MLSLVLKVMIVILGIRTIVHLLLQIKIFMKWITLIEEKFGLIKSKESVRIMVKCSFARDQPFRTDSDLSLYIINVHMGKLHFVPTQLALSSVI